MIDVIPCMPKIEAASQLRWCLEHGSVVPTWHFREEMAKENITLQDAHTVLRRGIIFDPPEENMKTGEWKYRIEGHEPGGKWMVIVFCFKSTEQVDLITIFSVQARIKWRRS
jgi:uncharacterized DUF497 family protein